MKNTFFIFILVVLPNRLLAANCGEGEIRIDASQFGPGYSTVKGYIRVVDASSLKVKEKKDAQALPLDLAGIVSRKAVCVDELYCFVLRRYQNERMETKQRWEVIRKDDPVAKAGTQSRVYVAFEFPKSTPGRIDNPLKISNSPTTLARRKSSSALEFHRTGSVNDVTFAVRVEENEVIIGVGREQASITLKMLTAEQSKKRPLSSTQNIVFKPVEQAKSDLEDDLKRDQLTKERIEGARLESKPVQPIQLNCLRETVEPGQIDFKKAAATPAGAASGAKK